MLLTSSTVAARNACLSLESIVKHKAGSQGALEREVLWEGLTIEGTFPTFRHKKFMLPDHSSPALDMDVLHHHTSISGAGEGVVWYTRSRLVTDVHACTIVYVCDHQTKNMQSYLLLLLGLSLSLTDALDKTERPIIGGLLSMRTAFF